MSRSRSEKSGGGLATYVIAVILLMGWLSSAEGGTLVWTLVLLALLVGIGVAVVYLMRKISGPSTPTARELDERLELVGAMSGPEFERFTANVFAAMGHNVTLLGGSGDQGVDLIVDYQGQRVAVQCKNYKKRVGNKPVQEVYAGARHHRCSQAWVVAPAGYTKGAHDLARSTGVRLFDAGSLDVWIGQVDKLGKERKRQNQLPATMSSPEPASDSKDDKIGESRKRAFWHPHPDDPPG